MKVDENEFFRQATLRICGSLDIEKALLKCLRYITRFLPVADMHLSLFEPGVNVIRNLARVGPDGVLSPHPPAPMNQDAIRRIRSHQVEGGVKIIAHADLDPVARLMNLHREYPEESILVMILIIEGEQLGSLVMAAEEGERFSETHAGLIATLREPLGVAMSNALRYREVLKLKEMVDAENRELNRELRYRSGDQIVGAEYGLKGVMEMVRQVASLDSPVMLLGETGVGKEVIANAIHYSSRRKDGAFVKVNCGAIPENLLDSELFGHEKGAFTGAIAQKRGRFERADGGTIFLDEVAELPIQAQVRLLRVLQNKEIERVGGERSLPINARIITATHRNLESMIRGGAFREDLWYRLNIFPISIPPLRGRKADIPALVDHFVERKSKELKLHTPPPISDAGIERLKAYHWPGNVRELENFVERELIRRRGVQTGRPLDFFHMDGSGPIEPVHRLVDSKPDLLSLDEAMARHIKRALELTGGKIHGPDGAGRLLGVNPNTLRGRMRKMGIPFGAPHGPRPPTRLKRPRRD
ncbi:MAG: AAA domain-containing protein [Desulfobacterales bacterium]|nr:AAA domain-containing protein [Desulfobacterales bacterium]